MYEFLASLRTAKEKKRKKMYENKKTETERPKCKKRVVLERHLSFGKLLH